MLLTTEVVTDVEKAAEILRWYSYRWHVEESINFGFWILDFGLGERLIFSPLVSCSLLPVI
jgi:hypothetical protein